MSNKKDSAKKNPHRFLGGDKLFIVDYDYFISLIAACAAISKRGKL